MELNEQQKKYLLKVWFDNDPRYFGDCTSLEYILSKDIELADPEYGWCEIYWDGRNVSEINLTSYREEYQELVNLGEY